MLITKKNKYPVGLCCLLLTILVLAGCAREDLTRSGNERNNALDNLRKPVIGGFSVNSKSYPGERENDVSALGSRKMNSVGIPGGGPNDPIASTYKDGDGWPDVVKNPGDQSAELFFRQKYKSQMFTISGQSMALNIYPGAILDGRSIDSTKGIFDPKLLQGISANIRPITISTSMPVSGSAIARTSLPRLSLNEHFTTLRLLIWRS